MNTRLRVTISAYKDEDMDKDFKPEGYYVHSDHIVEDDLGELYLSTLETAEVLINDVIEAIKHERLRHRSPRAEG